MKTWKVVINSMAGLGGIIIANKLGNKFYGDTKITNPVEAVGYFALLFAAGGVAMKGANDCIEGIEAIRKAVTTEPKKEEEETETEPEEEAEA